MATNFYGNGANSSAGANTIVHFYDRAGINAANRVNVYGQWADKRSMPTNYGKTFKVSKYEHMYDRSLNDTDFGARGFLSGRDYDTVEAFLNNSTDGAALGEGAGAQNKRTLKKVTYSCELKRYGEMIDYTDEVELFSEDVIQTRYREELGELANLRYEDLIQKDMLSTSTVMYTGFASSRAEIGSGIAADGSEDKDWLVSWDLIRAASRKLFRNRAKKNTMIVTGSTKIGTTPIAKAYYAIIGADVKSDLEGTTRGSVAENGKTDWVYVPAHKYAGADSLAEGEVGAMHEVRFIESESAMVYRGKGAGVPGDYVGSLSYTPNSASLVLRNLTNLAINITGVVAGNPYGTSVAAGAVVTATSEAHAAALDTGGLTRDLGKFDVFPILFPTQGSFATIGLKGNEKIKFNAKSPAIIDSTNTYGTTGFFSYNFFYAGIILRPEALLKIETAASN